MVACGACDSEFALPRVSAPEEYYDYEKPVFRWEFGEVCSELKAKSIQSNVLDLGCGGGAFVEYISQNGIAAEGIDFNNESVREAQRKGLPCSKLDLRDLTRGKRFSAITAFHVLEHVDDPRSLMEAIRGRLLPQGLAFVSFPNANRHQLHYRRDDADYPPNHLCRISAAGFAALAKSVGLQIQWVRTEPDDTTWLKSSSMMSNWVLDIMGIRRAVKSRWWLNTPVKMTAYLFVQPYVLSCQFAVRERQGYSVLYCLRRNQ